MRNGLQDGFTPIFRDDEDLLAECAAARPMRQSASGVAEFGRTFSSNLRRRQGPICDVRQVDELTINIRGEYRHLRRALGQDGDVFNVQATRRSDAGNRHSQERSQRREYEPWAILGATFKPNGFPDPLGYDERLAD